MPNQMQNTPCRPPESGTIIPFQLEGGDIRGRFAFLEGALTRILDQHNYPFLVEKFLAEAVLLSCLIAHSIKQSWKLSLQVRGQGALRFLATDYLAPSVGVKDAKIRGYASFDPQKISELEGQEGQEGKALALGDIFGKGYFALIITQGSEDKKPYQGISPLEGKNLGEVARAYFMNSEQLPSQFSLNVWQKKDASRTKNLWQGAGIMLQKLPSTPPPPPLQTQNERWHRLADMLEKLPPHAMIETQSQGAQGNKNAITALFKDENPQIFPARTVRFGCSCSEDRVRQSLSIYSQKEIKHMIRTDGKVGVTCQFCAADYEFAPESLGREVTAGQKDA